MSFGRLVNEADALLRAWLDKTAHKPGTRLPSERSLAVQLGLQHYSLNRAMSRLISEGRVERVGYKLFVAEAGAHPISRLTCHLVVAQRSIHLQSYKRVAKEMDIKLLVHTWQSIDEALLLLERLDNRDTEAVVLDPPYAAPVSLWTPLAEKLIRHGIPVVSLGQPSPQVYSVVPDSRHDLDLAVRHMVDLGHRELGFVTAPAINPTSEETLLAWGDLCRQHHLPRSIERVHFQDNNARLREEAAEVVGLLTGKWASATALILYSGLEYNLQLLQEQLAQKGRQVPRDLSIVFVGSSKPPATAIPPVTSAGQDMPLMQETAFHLALRAARKKKALGILPPPCCIRVQAQFVLRCSTRAPASLAGRKVAPEKPASAPQPARPPSQSLELCLRTAYPLAARASLSEKPRFAPVDLAPLVNRPLNFRRGWLGDLPLKELPPGRHEIHGVPFDILGGPRRTDCGAIVFHSAVNTTGNARPLPNQLSIPIKSKVKAVYILHGCGYAKFLHSFARYRFLHRKTTLGEVPLVALGQPAPGYTPTPKDAASPAPNIQDWWPDFPHEDFPNARMAPILESDEHERLPRHVFLYTYEWINPFPGKTVDTLEISVDPTGSTTLGVLAVTVLEP
ncbi:MAG: hypothetical protein K0R17_1466 [Rariglobus sp.]|jgi:DNA-binding LacI/PurR family transcriptional regulator|nr:hypothetical protein [Rariglobus sp.]